MIFYKIDLDVRPEMRDSDFMNKLALDSNDNRKVEPSRKFLEKVNSILDNKVNGEKFVMQAFQFKESILSLACCCNVERNVQHEIKNALDSALISTVLKDVRIDTQEEITAQLFVNNMKLAESVSEYAMNGRRRHRTWIDDFDVEYLRDDAYKVEEYVFDTLITKEKVFSEAEKIMADDSLMDELDGIYNVSNCRQFYGVPVHYKVVAASRGSALKMIEVLVSALHQVNRLVGTRVNYLCDFESDRPIDSEALESLFEKAQGATTIVELVDNQPDDSDVGFASNDIWGHLEKNILKFKKKNLIIFVEILGEAINAKRILNRFVEDMDIVEIKEGIGDAKGLETYILNMLTESEYKDFVDVAEIRNILATQTVHNISTAYRIYEKWNENVLKDKIYPVYKPLVNSCTKKEVKTIRKNRCLEELNSLIGLSPVKQVVKQMLATYSMQRTRNQLGLKTETFSKHMIFTGNPGVAKTTVARLLAGIFASEGVIKSPKFVECGRSDLVGKYVGWTAKIVKDKFKKAQGGILFIDEAYALVESHNSFGDEAINTIVQEMENNRDDVVVIFAGYPDKMKGFLDKNEGLRSRIAFHIDFPDYSPEELLDILKLMAKNKSYNLDEALLEKCKSIFQKVCSNSEFGNGRFVRNLLEQIIMKQSVRIYEAYGNKKVSKKVVCLLKAEDFDEGVAHPFIKESEAKRKCIGFVA